MFTRTYPIFIIGLVRHSSNSPTTNTEMSNTPSIVWLTGTQPLTENICSAKGCSSLTDEDTSVGFHISSLRKVSSNSNLVLIQISYRPTIKTVSDV